MNTKPKRRWFRFSLRTLLVLVTIAATGFGWLGIKVRAKQREREAVKAIEQQAGQVYYAHEWGSKKRGYINPAVVPGPTLLRRLLGDDFFTEVVRVKLLVGKSTEEELHVLQDLPHLEVLVMMGVGVTGPDLVYLEGLNQLEILVITFTPVTDADLAHLHRLTKLEIIELRETQVTAAGVEALQKALPNAEIRHYTKEVSDRISVDRSFNGDESGSP